MYNNNVLIIVIVITITIIIYINIYQKYVFCEICYTIDWLIDTNIDNEELLTSDNK